MKEYKIYYTQAGTIYDYRVAWVNADSKEEAVKFLKEDDWEHVIDTDVKDTDYDDYVITSIDSVEECTNEN